MRSDKGQARRELAPALPCQRRDKERLNRLGPTILRQQPSPFIPKLRLICDSQVLIGCVGQLTMSLAR